MSEYKNVWAYVEVSGGKAKNVGLEIVVQGKKIAEAGGEKVVAVLIGNDLDDAAKAAASFGADQIITVSGDS